MDVLQSAPILPPELERLVFEAAASTHLHGIPNLMLVAWRVKDWVEPLLYHILCLSETPSVTSEDLGGFPVMAVDTLLHHVASKGLGFFRHAVRDLLIHDAPRMPADKIDRILEACTGLTSLFAYFTRRGAGTTGADFPILDAMERLQRLTTNIDSLFEGLNYPPKYDLTRPLFRNVTHLELLGPVYDESSALTFDCIPHLTHIAFNSFAHPRLESRLCADGRLLCIVFLDQLMTELKDDSPLVGDPRLVCIDQDTDYRVDWLVGATGGRDYWTVADEFIAARRAGKVPRSRYLIRDTDQWPWDM
ncbi:hypothetical protein C8R46DRAFT_599922 [Mycena filopes]|nr:hypothetical protein C8R46DRAFT_599922 [Mycena filopes]